MSNIDKLSQLINELPGIGKKASKKMAIKLIENKDENIDLLNKINESINEFEVNKKTNIIETLNQKEVNSINPLLVVFNNFEAQKFMDLFDNDFNYFNLNINTIADISRRLEDDNTIANLIDFIKEKNIKEVVFGLSPKVETDVIIRVITNEILKSLDDIEISKLPVGMPIGSMIEYSDEKTIKQAINNREKI